MFDNLRNDLQKLLDDGISREAAVVYVANEAETNKPKRRETIKEAVDIAVTRTVARAIQDHRRSICRRAEGIAEARAQGSKKLAEKVAGLMGYRLPSGVALSEATGPECEEAANFYLQNAEVHYRRASFLREVAHRVGTSVVGEVLQEADLQDSYEKSRKSS